MQFKEWIVNETAIGPQNIQHDAQGRPNFRVYILNSGQNVGLELLTNGSYKYAGDMFGQVFNNTDLLEGYRIFNWHSDLPEGAGYGPMFYEICMEIATIKGGYLASMTLVNRLDIIKSGKDFNYENAQDRKGAAGGDTSDRAEGVYKKFYERGDIEKIQPKISLDDPDYSKKPWMYQLYRKNLDVLTKLMNMNRTSSPVFVRGTGHSAQPITNINSI
jgi:hypothetical protein